jgi:hypothetical protein
MPLDIRGDAHNLKTIGLHDTLVRYVLGAELDKDELRRIEHDYFSDVSAMNRLRIVEDELIERYIDQNLTTDEVRLFEEHFLASARNRERLEFFRALSRWAPRSQPTISRRTIPVVNSRTFPLIAAALLLIIVPWVWLVLEYRQLVLHVVRLEQSSTNLESASRGRAGGMRDDQQLRPSSEDARGSAAPPARSTTSEPSRLNPVLSFLLMPSPGTSATRGSGSADAIQHAIPASINTLQLDLILSPVATAKVYTVSIETPDGVVVWSGGPVTAVSLGALRIVRILLPVAVIGQDDYVVYAKPLGGDDQRASAETYLFRTLTVH